MDTQLNQGSGVAAAGSANAGSQGVRDEVLRLAASQVLGGRSGPGDLALVGLTDPTNSLKVGDLKPARSVLAAVVEPVDLRSADSLGSLIKARTRLVSTYSGDGSTAGIVDVYDLEIPNGVTGPLQLGYVYLNMANSPVGSVEVYNWITHSWHALPAQGPPFRGQQTSPLDPGELTGGLIRTRIRESSPYDSQLTVSGP